MLVAFNCWVAVEAYRLEAGWWPWQFSAIGAVALNVSLAYRWYWEAWLRRTDRDLRRAHRLLREAERNMSEARALRAEARRSRDQEAE